MSRHKTRILYMEQKTGDNAGEARIGRVRYSRSGRTLYYKDKAFVRIAGRGIYGNYSGYDRKTFEECANRPSQTGPTPGYLGEFWISGPKKNGDDRHPCERQGPVEVDEDVAAEYWTGIRGQTAAETAPGW
jgi:hypothetical protein